MKCFEIDLNQTLRVAMLNSQTYTPPTTHLTRYNPEYIVYILTAGKLVIEENGIPLTLLPGDVYIFKKGDHQKAVESTYFEFYYIHFDTDYIKELELTNEDYCRAVTEKKRRFSEYAAHNTACYSDMQVLLRQHTHIESKEFLYFITDILKNNRLIGNTDAEGRYKISAAVASLLFKLEDVAFMQLHSGKKSNSWKTYYTVKSIADYIKQKYNTPLSSEDIERKFSINFDHANRRFKKQMGINIFSYRNALRINSAKEMLALSDKNISEIAYETGFENPCYFSRYFRKSEGVSPTEYRENHFEEKMTKDIPL